MQNFLFDSLMPTTISPMIVLLVGALAIICIDMWHKGLSRNFYVMFCVIFLIIALAAVIGGEQAGEGFFGLIYIDGFAKVSQIIIITASLLFAPLALSAKEFTEYRFAEYFAFLLFVAAGFVFMVSSTNLIMIFVALETASLALYAMIAMHNRRKAVEAALKYFTMGALSSGLFAFGAMIFYALSGSLDIITIVQRLSSSDMLTTHIVAAIGACSFMIASLGFKLSVIPFHTWTPDVYEGSTAALAGFMSVVPKIAGFIVVLRLFGYLITSGFEWAQDIFYILAVITMTLSNLMALVQTDVKRMLAISSISHAGYVLCAVLIDTPQAMSGLFLYWVLFMFVNFGAFTLLWISRNRENLFDARYQHPYTKFSGMIKLSPMAAVIMALFMLSLAGIPPFSVFWGKIYIMSAALNAGFVGLAVIMAINSAIAVYYYLKLIVYMFLKEPIAADAAVLSENTSRPLMVVVGVSVVTAVAAIILVEPILAMVNYYIM
jgi:NADH-quinone oxidoreductase subunit N